MSYHLRKITVVVVSSALAATHSIRFPGAVGELAGLDDNERGGGDGCLSDRLAGSSDVWREEGRLVIGLRPKSYRSGETVNMSRFGCVVRG